MWMRPANLVSVVVMPLNLSRSDLAHRPGDGTSLREGLVS